MRTAYWTGDVEETFAVLATGNTSFCSTSGLATTAVSTYSSCIWFNALSNVATCKTNMHNNLENRKILFCINTF